MQQASVATMRRQHERRPVKANAFVHCGGRFQRAKVVDYSQGGLQLEGTFGLMRRDTIQIELLSGTRVPGRVAWSLGAYTGIAFTEILPSTHPAMVELTRKTSEPSLSRVR
jgi:PilZ domain